MTNSADPHNVLCELHAHLAGWADADLVLERIRGRPVDWSAYANSYERAYGEAPRIRRILSRINDDPAARDEFRRLYEFQPEDGGNFDRFQAKFDLISWSSAFAGSDRCLNAEIRKELDTGMTTVAADCHRLGIGHVELRIMLGQRRSVELRREVLEHLAAACAEHSNDALQMRLVFSLSRGEGSRDCAWLGEVMDTEVGRWLTAVDFCHYEEGHPPKRDAAFSEWLHEFNASKPNRALALLYHTGESYRDKSLESAVRWCHEAAELGAHRLGHCLALGLDPTSFGRHQRYERLDERLDQIGYDLAHADGLRACGVRVDEDALRTERAELRGSDNRRMFSVRYGPDRLDQVSKRQDFVLQGLARHGTVLEVCPSSNCRVAGIAPSEHPIKRFLKAGVTVVIGTDDPGLLGTDLPTELDLASGGDPALRQRLIANAWRARSEALSGRSGNEIHTRVTARTRHAPSQRLRI